MTGRAEPAIVRPADGANKRARNEVCSRAMPIHDWTRVVPGTFHAFHVSWISELQGALNAGVLPDGYYALAEQTAHDIGPDVLTLRLPQTLVPDDAPLPSGSDGGIAVATAPPTTAVQDQIARGASASIRRRPLVIRHASTSEAVAVLEVVSPSSKRGPLNTAVFVERATAVIDHGIHLVVLDLFPPGRSDPDGLHALIWGELGGTYVAPADRPLTLASYVATPAVRSYVEPSAVGMSLAELPLFLSPQRYVNVPLETAYMAALAKMPRTVRDVIEPRRPA